ncbi:MAG: SpoIIE family protein phosphatase [Candidatus Aquicultorales bacterium]
MKGGIKQKLLVIYLIVILPLTGLVGFNYYRFYMDKKGDTVRDQYHLAKLAAGSLERYTREVMDNNKSIGTAIYTNNLDIPRANALLASVKQNMPAGNLFYVNRDGIVSASTVPGLYKYDALQTAWYKKLAVNGTDSVVGQFGKNANGEYGFVVFTAIRSGGKLAAVTGTIIDGRDLHEVVPRELLKGIVVYTDNAGRIVYSSAAPTMGLTERNWSTYEPVKKALSGVGYADENFTLPGLDGRYVGSIVPVQSTGWTAGYFTSFDEAYAGLRSEVVLSLLFILGVIGVSTGLGVFYTRRLSRPIIQLSARTVEIGEGDFDEQVDIKTGDEIEILAGNFNRMQSNLKQNFTQLTDLFEASKSVNAAHDVEAVSAAAAVYLREILRANVAIVRMKDEETGRSRIVYSDGLAEGDAEKVAESADAFLGSSADDLQAVSFYNLIDVGSKAAVFKEADARALVTLPLVASNRLIGRIDVLATEETGSKLGRAEMGLAINFAQQVSVALENARLLERQQYIADVLQDSLLTNPKELPGLEVGLAYHPATVGAKVGGDFYDFIDIDADRVAVVMGDISGKGIEAARHTALAKNAVRSFAFEDPSPRSVVERANKLICGESESYRFVTLFYALIDRKTGDLHFASAGHPPAFYYEQKSNRVNELAASGLPLGIDPHAVYEERSIVLGKHDKLLIYTDGLTEARRDNEMLGQHGVKECFLSYAKQRATDMAPKLIDVARRFAGGELLDDVAVIVLERETTALASVEVV